MDSSLCLKEHQGMAALLPMEMKKRRGDLRKRLLKAESLHCGCLRKDPRTMVGRIDCMLPSDVLLVNSRQRGIAG